MRITIFGTGYVGLVTGACLAEVGHQVLCMDIDAGRIARLQKGEIPIYEPGLDVIVRRNIEAGTLAFTGNVEAAVRHGSVQFIAVGTPSLPTGTADISGVIDVAGAIGAFARSPVVVVVKSTVPVGTCDKVRETISARLDERHVALHCDVVSNPEFLKEGAAIADFQRPDRIVIGSASARARATMVELYEPFNRNRDRLIHMDIRSAELTKYAANAMLATRISFMNEIANVAERLGADIEQVRKGIGSDPRIGYDFIYAGIGYGGSCFPKDVRALISTAADAGYDAELIRVVDGVNVRQKTRLIDKVIAHFGSASSLRGKRFAIWGLSFKPNTDDVREAPARAVIDALLAAGAHVRLFDPGARENAQRIYANLVGMELADDRYDALDRADALVLCTEWREFRAPDFNEMAARMRRQVIFDGRNLYSHERLREEGWSYYSIGRAPALPEPAMLERRA